MRVESNKSAVFVALIVGSGAAVLGHSLWHWTSPNWNAFLLLLVTGMLASRLHVKLPGVTGNMSVNLPFILIAAAEMNAPEALLVGCLSTTVQCLPQAGRKFNWKQGLFNVANIALAVSATRLLYHSAELQSAISSPSLLLAVAAAGYFLVNSVPVAIVIGLTEKKNVMQAWAAMAQLSYPYYLAGAGVAAAVLAASAHTSWLAPLVVLPLSLAMFYSYRHYFVAVSSPQAEEILTRPSWHTYACGNETF